MTRPTTNAGSTAAGAYVLGAMAPDERDEFEAHLVTCTICSGEVDELRPAAEALPMASPPMVPPAALKDRIMAEVEREARAARAGRPERRPAGAGARAPRSPLVVARRLAAGAGRGRAADRRRAGRHGARRHRHAHASPPT